MDREQQEQLQAYFAKTAKNEIRIRRKRAQAPLPAMCSRIGGKPSVPKDFIWPYYDCVDIFDGKRKHLPLSFIAQIKLSEIADLDVDGFLPQNGVLSFFYELDIMDWGNDPANKGSAVVLYFPDESALHIADYPVDMKEKVMVPEYEIEFEQRLTVPEYDRFEHRRIDPDEYAELAHKCGYVPNKFGDHTKLFGFPDVIQGPMESDCEAISRGYHRAPSGEELDDIDKKASEWMLLFQMASLTDDEPGEYYHPCKFGCYGNIYYWIKRNDLLARKFENAWLILQCY